MFAVEFVTSRPVNAPAYYGLCAPGTYVLGRSSECHLSISSADISRQHLTLRVVLRDEIHEALSTDALQNLADAFEDDEEPFITPIVLIVENRSQFGCRVDAINLKNLGAQAAITSGGGNIYVGSIVLRCTYRPVIVSVNDETFAPEFVEEVSEMYAKLGADVVVPAPQPIHGSVWTAVDHVARKASHHFELENFNRLVDERPLPHIANMGAPPVAKFLVTGAIDASPQCLLALAFGYTLVHPSFVFEFFASLADTCIEPTKNAPHPSKYEPQISRAVFPKGGYARPEGRSLPFPLFPPALDTPWYKSRHRLLMNCLATFRDQDVASSLVEVITALGARMISWGSFISENNNSVNVSRHKKKKKRNKSKKASSFLLDIPGSSGGGKNMNMNIVVESGSSSTSASSNDSDDGISSSSTSEDSSDEEDDGNVVVGTGAAGGFYNNNTSLAGNSSLNNSTNFGGTATTRSRRMSGGPRNLPPRGSRASDVDSATGEPLLLPHQIARRQAQMEKKKKEMEARLQETMEMNQAREETLNMKDVRKNNTNNHNIVSAAALSGMEDDAHKFITSDAPHKHDPRRKLLILSPAEVAELTATVLANNSMIPNDAQQHNELGMNNLVQIQNNFNALLNNNNATPNQQQPYSATGMNDDRTTTISPLQEDILMYARRGWDIISTEQILHSLLTCEPLGVSLLDHLIAPPQPTAADGSVPRLTEKNLEELQHHVIMSENGGSNQQAPNSALASGTQHPLDAKQQLIVTPQHGPTSMTNPPLSRLASGQQLKSQHQSGQNLLSHSTSQQQLRGAGVDQFTEKNSDMDSDRTPSEIDSQPDDELIGKSHALASIHNNAKPFSTAGSTKSGTTKQAKLPDESISVTLQLDRTKSTVLARLRKACERNVLSYKNRLAIMKKVRDAPGSTKLDEDKLSVVRDALQSCETFLSHLEEAEEHMTDAEREVEMKLRRAQEQEDIAAAGTPHNNNLNNTKHSHHQKNNGNSPILATMQRQFQESTTQHQLFADAVDPLRKVAADVAQIAYSLLRRDEPALSRAPHKWSRQQRINERRIKRDEDYENQKNNNFLLQSNFMNPQKQFYADPNGMRDEMERNIQNQQERLQFQQQSQQERGSPGNFSGIVQPWEKATMKSANVTSNSEQFYGGASNNNQQYQRGASNALLEQIDEELKRSSPPNSRTAAKLQQQYDDQNNNNNNNTSGEASIHPLTNWVRYSPDIPVQARSEDIAKPIIPRGVAIAPTFKNNSNMMTTGRHANPESTSGGMRGGDLMSIANFRKSLIAQHGISEGGLRFELWLGSQSSQWTMKFHSELEKRGLKFSEWLNSGQEENGVLQEKK